MIALMHKPVLILAAAFLALCALFAGRGYAQDALPRESIEIGLSTNQVAITSGFTGADLTIFGALDNANLQVLRQGRYDIIVVLEGPSRPIIVRRKSRIAGVWVNTQSVEFENVPMSYSVATTRLPQDITTTQGYQQLALGADNIFLAPANPDESKATVSQFTDALRERKSAAGLYNERVGGVQFLSQNLFRASLAIPADVSVGTHRARAFLFRNGEFVTETSEPLVIQKSGLEALIFETAREQSLLYGFLAVLLAIVTGWLGRVIFKRD